MTPDASARATPYWLTGPALAVFLALVIIPLGMTVLLAFYDWGQVQQYHHNRYASSATTPLLARNRITLQGAGLALTWRGGQGTQIQATWARRIGSNPLATPSGADTDGSLHKNRFWINASIAF